MRALAPLGMTTPELHHGAALRSIGRQDWTLAGQGDRLAGTVEQLTSRPNRGATGARDRQRIRHEVGRGIDRIGGVRRRRVARISHQTITSKVVLVHRADHSKGRIAATSLLRMVGRRGRRHDRHGREAATGSAVVSEGPTVG